MQPSSSLTFTQRLRHSKKPIGWLMVCLMAFWLPAPSLRGATLLWDGGTNTWDNNSTAWWNTGVWTNSFDNIAQFGGTAGVVTLASPFPSAGGLIFNSSGYSLTGGTLTLGAPTGSNSPVILVNGMGNRVTIESILAGTNGFTKSGNGTMVLTNNSNSIGGDIAIKSGNLVISNAGQLGTGTTAISITGLAQNGNPGFSGGTLLLQGGATSASGAGVTLTREVSGAGRGPGAVNNTGSLVSVGYNTLAGGLTLGSTTGENRIWATHGTTTLGSLYLGTVGQNQYLQGNGNWTVTGVVTGAENLSDRFIKTGQLIGTTLWLQNAGNTFTDALRVDSGTVRVALNSALGQNLGTGQVDLNNGTLEARTDFASGFAGRTVRIRNNTTGTIFFDHDLSGGLGIGSSAQNQTLTMGALTRDAGANPGNITLNGRNGYNVSFSSFLPAAGDYRGVTVTNNSSGTATINGDVWNANSGTASTFTVTGGGDSVITGRVVTTAVANNFAKAGSGTLTMTQGQAGSASTFEGDVSITDGTLALRTIEVLNDSTARRIILSNGAISYLGDIGTGAGETWTNKILDVANTNAYVLANQSGTAPTALILPNNWGATNAGTGKTLNLGGTSALNNEIQGLVTNGKGITNIVKYGTGTWQIEAPTSYGTGGTISVAATGTTATNVIVLTTGSTGSLVVGQPVSGVGFAAGSVITGIVNGTTFTVNQNRAASAAADPSSVIGVASGATAALTNTVASTASATPVITVASTANLVPGQRVTSTSLPASQNWYIRDITSSTTVTLVSSTGATSAIVPVSEVLTPVASPNFGGNLTVSNGTMRAAAATATSDIINMTSNLIFGNESVTNLGNAGGTFEYAGFASGSSNETLGRLNPAAGHGIVKITNGTGADSLTFLDLSRSAGATLDLQPGIGAIGFTTAPALTNSVLPGYATFNGVDFVTISGGNAAQYTGATPWAGALAPTSTVNYSVAGAASTSANGSVNSLKLTGGAALTLGGTLGFTTNPGGLLFDNSAGTASITGAFALGTAAQELVITTNGSSPATVPDPGDALATGNVLSIGSGSSNTTISSGAGSLTKAGTGTLVLFGGNAYTGNTTINQGAIQLSGLDARLGTISTVGNITTIRQNGILDINAAGALAALYTGGLTTYPVTTIGSLSGSGMVTNSGGGGTTQATLNIGLLGTTTSSATFSGALQDGAGFLNVTKNGTGTQAIVGTKTYTGVTTINAGTLAVTSLANGGISSGLGASDNAASNLIFGGGVLLYTGASASGAGIYQTTQTPSVSTDRLFSLAGNATIQSSGTFGNESGAAGTGSNHASLILSATGAPTFLTAGAKTVTLGGTSIGDNEFRLNLINNTIDSTATALTKANGSLWILNPNTSNTYTGTTTISGGALRVAAADAAVQGLSANSPLVLSGGVLETSGNFTRTLGAPVAGVGTVQLPSGASGFSAATPARLVVTIGGGAITWGGTNFNPSSLVLGSSTALGETEITNDIAIGAATRTITVNNNGSTGTMVTAGILSGVISGAGTGGNSLIKNGGGVLMLGNANTYTGSTRIDAGNVIATSIGTGVSSSLGASGALIYNPGDTDLNGLFYVGAGETANRNLTFQASASYTANRTYRIDSSGSGPLVWDSGTFAHTTRGDSVARALTLDLRGANTDLNQLNLVLANSTNGTNPNVLHINKNDGGVWVLNPASANTFTGNINISGGTLGLTANGIGSAGTIAISNAALMAYGAPLTITNTISHANNAAVVFVGTNNITLNGAYSLVAGNNAMTFSNNLEGGAIVTVNGAMTNLKVNDQPFNIRGFGSTVWNGLIPNAAANTTTLDIRIADNATFTLSGATANTYTGATLLGQGTLILNKNSGVAQFGASSSFTFSGGSLQAGLPLIGADKINTQVTLGGDQATVIGTNSIEFGAATALVNSGGNRFLRNELTGGATLTISGGVSLSNDATGRTLTVRGASPVTISGVVGNGGAGAGGLAYSGLSSLTLTNANTATGALTVNRNSIILSGAGASGGAWNSGTVTLNPIGTLTLDNSAGNATTGRLNDAGAVTGQGGTLNIIGAPSGTNETAGALTLNSVQSFITLTDNSGGAGNSLTFASVAFANSGSSLNLAGVPDLGTTNRVLFTAAPSGATVVFNGVIPRIYLGGTDFAKYDVTNGVVPLVSGDYNAGNNLNTAAAADTLDLTATSTLTGFRTINALKLNGTGVSVGGAANTRLTLTSGGLINTGGNNSLDAPAVSFTNTPIIQVASGTTLTVNSALVGAANLVKALPGTLVLNTGNFVSGTHNLLSGTTKLISQGLNTFFPGQLLNIDKGATLDLNGGTQYVGGLTAPGVLPESGGLVTSNSGLHSALIVSNMAGGSGTFATNINDGTDVVHLARVGGNTLTLESVNTYSGATTMLGGTLQLQDDATILNTSQIDLNAATLILNNNSSLQRAIYNRVADATEIYLRDGTFSFTGKVSDASTETVGIIRSVQGANTITVTTGGTGTAGAVTSADVTFASLDRSVGTTVNFTGTNLGQLGNNARIVFATAPTTVLSGVLGAWAIANTTDYAAYNTGLGVGVVGQGGFTGYDGTFASGNITELPATAATTTTLSGATTTGLLRIAGAFTNDIAFTAGTDSLNLEQGGILRSNNNNATTIGTSSIRGHITSSTNELIVFNNQGTTTINSFIDGATTRLIKSGGGTLSLTANNTYGGGTTVDQGTLSLNGTGVVIPAGGLIIGGATVTMVTNAGQIDPSNVVTIRRSSTLTMVGNNTLDSLAFDNNGGTTNPTVNVGGILTLSNSTPISVITNNAATTPTITGGALALAGGAKTIDVGPINLGGTVYTAIQAALNIASPIFGPGTVTKTNTGLLQLSGQSTFSGLTVSAGGIVIGAGSTQSVGTVTSGPLGVGQVAMASGTVLVSNNTQTIANPISFAGTPMFDSTANTVWTNTFTGVLSGAGVTGPSITVNVNNPFQTVALLGTFPGTFSSITKTGLGTLIFNATNYTGDFNATALGNPNAVTLIHDGNGTGSVQTIAMGNVIFDAGIVPNITVNRGGSLPFAAAVNKILAPASITNLGLGLTVTTNNGYGLQASDSIAFSGTPAYTVSGTQASNVTQGLYLTGDLTGSGFVKTNTGTLVINNALPANNTFTGNVNINQGVVSVNSDAQLGNAANLILLNPQAGTATFRATDNITTSRVIQLSNTANTRAIEVSNGKTLTLNSAFDLNAGAGTSAALNKQDLGTLVVNVNNPTWSGAVNITEGAILVNNPLLTTPLGTGTINAGLAAVVGSALQLAGGVTVSNPLNLQSANNLLLGGINFQGQLDNVSGANTYSGAISHAFDATIGARAGSTLDITGLITSTGTHRLIFNAEGDINASGGQTGAMFGFDKFGAGTLTITSALFGGTITTGGIKVEEGTLILSGAGTTNSSGAVNIVYGGATMRLDNSGTNTNNRLTARALTLQGGTFDFIANNSTETAGAFVSDQGANTINLGGSGTAGLTFSGVTHSAGSSLNVTGTFGTATNFLKFTANPALTPVTTGILNRVTVNGNELASYSASLGVVAFTGYSPVTNILSAGATQTYKATTSTLNSLTGNQTINALTINDTAAVGGLGGLNPATLTLTSGTVLANGSGGAFLNTPIVAFGAAEALIHVQSGQSLTVNSGMFGTGGLSKDLAGQLDINAQQFVAGTHYINGGTLKLTSTGVTNPLLFNQAMAVNVGGTVDLNGQNQFIAGLSSASAGGSTGLGGGTVTNSAVAQSTFTINGNTNFGGLIDGNIFLNKTGTGALNLQQPQTYTGPTLLTGGTTTLNDMGALPNTSQPISINFAALSLANGNLYALGNRVSNTAPITLKGGVLAVAGRQQLDSSETFGAIILADGHNALTTGTGGTNVNSLEVTAASLTRTGATATMRFNATGQLGSSARLMFTAAPTLTNNIIGPWAIVDREYASYDSTYGIGALNGNGYAGYSGTSLFASPTSSDNVRFSNAGTTVLLANTTVNTLTFGQQSTATTLNLGGNTLATQGVLFGQLTDNINFAITNGSLTGPAGGGDLYITHANFSGTNRTASIDAAITDNGGAVRVIKTSGDTGASVMTWNGNNTYTGGTVLNMGTLVLGATSTLGTGGLTVNQATLTQTAGAVIPAQALTLGGGSTVTLVGNNSLTGLTINNMGGAAPTLTPTGVLTLTGGTTVSTMNAGLVATIGTGTLDLNLAAAYSINVGATVINSVDVAPWQAGLIINSVVQNGGIAKTGAGLLQLGGQSTFAGGITVATGGGLIIGASSTPAGIGDTVVTGPLGTGAVIMAANTTLLSTAANAVSNDFTFLGDTVFNGIQNLTLNGLTTLPAVWNAVVTAPQMTVTIGNASGSLSTDEVNKSGLGTLSIGSYNGTINAAGGLVFLADGNTLGTPENVSLGGNVALTADTSITVNRSGAAPNARNKTLDKVNLTNNGSILAVSNLSGYGLEFTGTTILTGASHFSVVNATASNLVQGLTLAGVVSDTGGFDMVKSGAGTLALTNSGNTFGGPGKTIDILNGVLSTNSDGALGNINNSITLDVDGAVNVGFRATGTFGTARTFILNQLNNAIEVTAGNTLTLNTALTLSNVLNCLHKNDNGTLVLAADNSASGWSNTSVGLNINAGVVRLSVAGAAGASTNAISINNAVGSALQLSGGITVANPVTITGSSTSGGINGSGHILSLSGVNTYSGLITQSNGVAGSYGAAAGATLNITGGIATVNSAGFYAEAGGVVNLQSAYANGGAGGPSFIKTGNGVLNVTSSQSAVTSAITVNGGTMTISGSGVKFGGTGAVTVAAASTLAIDDTGTATASRLSGRPMTLQGGTFSYLGNAGTSTESLGALTTARGNNTILANSNGGTSTITFSRLSTTDVVAGDTSLNFISAGAAFGSANNKIIFTTAPALTNSIIQRATVNGTDFATYGANGIAAFAAYNAGSTTNINSVTTATGTVDANAAMTTKNLTANRTFNAIRLSGATNQVVGATGAAFVAGGLTPAQLILNAGGILATGGGAHVISVPVLSMGISSGTTTVQEFISVDTGTSLEITSANIGNAGWVKTGAGTLTFSPPSSPIAGRGASTITGTANINNGTVVLNGGNNTLAANQFLAVEPGGTLDLNGNSQLLRGLLTNASYEGGGGIVTGATASSTLVINNDNTARSWSGQLTGALSLMRTGDNTLTLYSDNTYTGSTSFSGGATTLRDGARLSGTSDIEIVYSTLNIDNAGGVKDLTDRIKDTAPITLRGGTLAFLGRAQTASVETVGAVTLAEGASFINSTLGGTGINSADLTLTSLNRAVGGGTVNFTAATGGQIGSSARILIPTINGVSTNSVGGGLTNGIIGGWAVFGTSDFATYVPGLGVAAMGANGALQYSNATSNSGTLNAASSTDNISLNVAVAGNTVLVSNDLTINSLRLGNVTGMTIAIAPTKTLTLGSGGLLFFSNQVFTIGSAANQGNLTSGGSELFVYTQGSANEIINSTITGSGVTLVKSGSGTVTLNGTNTYDGGTTINQGTVNLGPLSNIPLAANPANGLILSGSTLTLTATGQIASGNIVTINGNSVANLFGNNTLAGLVFSDDGGGSGASAVNSLTGVLTLTGGITSTPANPGSTSTVGGRLDLGATTKSLNISATTFNGQELAALLSDFTLQGMVGSAGGFTKDGNGVLQFNGQAVYTGLTDVVAGRVQVGAANAGSRFSRLNLQSGTALNLNGFSTILGSLSGSGFVMNSSASTTAQTLTVGFDGTSSTFSGTFQRFNDATPNTSNLTKIGAGTLTLTAPGASSTSGGLLTINRGVVAYTDAGSSNFITSAMQVNEGGTIRLDNTGTVNVNNRLNGGALALNGGTLEYLGRASTASTELGGVLTLGASASTINLTAGAGGTALVTFASLTQSAGATAIVSGTNLGTDTKLLFTTAPTLVPATTGILSRIAVGTDFATYNATNGVTAFTGYTVPTDINLAAATNTVEVTSATTMRDITLPRTINAVKVTDDTVALGSNGLLLPTQGLTVTSGGVLVNGNSAAISTPVLAFGGTEAIFRVNGTSLDILSSITGTAGFTKTGLGNMTISARQSYTGQTALSLGNISLAAGLGANPILVAPTLTATVSNLQVNGGTFDLNGNNQIFGALLNSNTLGFADGVITNSSITPSVLTSATGTGSTFSANLTGNLAFTKSGTGALTFPDTQSYTGATIIRGGTLTLQDKGALYSGVSLTSASVALEFSGLTFNNSNLSTLAELNPVRLPAAVPVTLRGSTLAQTAGGSVDTTGTINSLTVLGGGSTITVNVLGSAGATNTLNIGNLVRTANNGSTIHFASDLGQPGQNQAQVFISQINGVATVNNSFLGAGVILNSGEYGVYNTIQGVIRYGATAAAGNTVPAYAAALASGNNLPANISSTAADVAISANTTIGALRLTGAATRAITFTAGTEVLNLALGGLLRDNVNNATNIGTTALRGVLTSGGTATTGVTELVEWHNQSTVTINSVIANNGLGNLTKLVKAGPAGTTLTAANTYTGGTVVNAGTLTINATAGAGTVVIPAGGITLNNANLTMSTSQGQIDSTNDVTINGGGVLTLTGNNTLKSVTFANMGGTATPSVVSGTSLTLSDPVAISVTNHNLSSTPTISGTAVTLSNANPVINVNSGLSPSGLIISATLGATTGPIVKTGGGSLILGGTITNNLTTGMNVDAGTLVFDNTNATTPYGAGTIALANGVAIRGGTAARTVSNPVSVAGDFTFGTLDADNGTANATNNLTLSGTTTLSAGTHDIKVNGLLMVGTITGQLTGGNGVSKSGPGTLVLQNATNNYGGSTTVSAGTLQIGAAGSIPDASALVVSSGGFFNVNGLAETVGSLAGAGVITNTGAAQTLTTGGDGTNTTFSGIITNQANALGLTKTGAGTQTLTGANTYTGNTTINGGILNVGSAETAGVSGPLGTKAANAAGSVIFGGGTLQYSAANQNDYSGRFSTAASQPVSIDTNGQNVTFATPLSSTGGTLAKSGAGVLSLTPTATYTGATTVTGGTLEATVGLNGTSGVTVSGTDTVLRGSGTFTGSTIIGTGSVLAPGVGGTANDNKTLTFTQAGTAVTVDAGGSIELSLTSSTKVDPGFVWSTQSAFSYLDTLTSAGTNFTDPAYTMNWMTAESTYDSIVLTNGTFAVSGGVTLTNNGGSTYGLGQIFKLLDWNGLGSNDLGGGSAFNDLTQLNLAGISLGAGLAWDTSAFSTYGVVVVVPEPSRAVLLLLGLLGLMLRRRRRSL